MRVNLLVSLLVILNLILLVLLAFYLLRFREFKQRIQEVVEANSKDIDSLVGAIKDKLSISQVKEKTRLLSQALNLLNGGLVIMDPYGRLVYANRFARTLLGIEDNYLGKFYHQAISDLDVISFINSNFNSKYRLWENKKIKDRFVQIIFASDMDEKALLIHDLTQIKKYENLKRDFIANVSHEFKTPVATLKLLMETLEDECRGDEHAESFIKKAMDRVKYMEQLIQDLITLSMLETSKGVMLNMEYFKLKEFFDGILEEVEFLAKQKGISLENMVDDKVEVKSDRKLLYIVFKNLVDNAIKYNNLNGKVVIEYSKLPKDHVISVCDTGSGIPKSHLPFIFERFYRVDRSRSRKLGGTGLGLSIVKLAVERVEGKVIVESKEGEGTCFKVFIPG
jgi:two-component system phosphate regulon sensor histidine kinase PhoR